MRIWAALVVSGLVFAADPAPTFRKYCFGCHANGAAMGGVSLDKLTASNSWGDTFQTWRKVTAVLGEKKMPPKGLPQPTDEQRQEAIAWVRTNLDSYIQKHAGDPGRVTVRRLTSGEYRYAIQDLTGLDLDSGIDASADSVGGEGFTNFGDVQFMQDANLERYLQAAKFVADHAVIGSGPLEFFADPGKTGFELSAISRIREIYAANGFRTVSGEGGRPFGLEKYGKALFVAWRFRNLPAGSKTTLDSLAVKEGISGRFARHIWSVLNQPALGFPLSEVVGRWRKIPGGDEKVARTACTDIQKFVTTWPSWLFARGDVAAGGAGDESPLMLNDASLAVEPKRHFKFLAGLRRPGQKAEGPRGPVKIFLHVTPVNPGPAAKPMVIWKNATIAFRKQPGPLTPSDPAQPLRSVITSEMIKKLRVGQGSEGLELGPNDFASSTTVGFEVPLPEGAVALEFQADAQLGADRDVVMRILLSERSDGGSRGIPVRALLGDPQSLGYRTFKKGVLELAALMPPNSHAEPTPADKDPVPAPFDSTFNVPEHDEFVNRVKYIRDDRYVIDNMLDPTVRQRLNRAWSDLMASFDYHDNYLQMIAAHFKYDLKVKRVGELDKAAIEAMPADVRPYAASLRTEFDAVMRAQAAARPGHVADCLKFASLAWRRPLTEAEKQNLRTFYDKAVTTEGDHPKAIRALLTRILVSPAFLYRVEGTSETAAAKPLNPWELASRMSFFLWSSIPDGELRRAASTGELADPIRMRQQVKRMLADVKARRLATEFFGQWFGFYRFDEHKGVDTSRFPEFTQEVKESMYDEAVSFFEHIVRKDRPVMEVVTADYAFLNNALAKYYAIPKEIKSEQVELTSGAGAFHRGGVLRLGAILTATSAPLRTSPVKRGDWVLRRVLGTAVPPPPADAGSIPADDKLFGGLSVKERLEVHKRNATCANCHARIDPLGFALENYDSTGRWREKYPDGKPVDAADNVEGLLKQLREKDEQFRRTLAVKLIGYGLGRTVLASDQPLIDQMVENPGTTFSEVVADLVASPQFRRKIAETTGREVAHNVHRVVGRTK